MEGAEHGFESDDEFAAPSTPLLSQHKQRSAPSRPGSESRRWTISGLTGGGIVDRHPERQLEGRPTVATRNPILLPTQQQATHTKSSDARPWFPSLRLGSEYTLAASTSNLEADPASTMASNPPNNRNNNPNNNRNTNYINVPSKTSSGSKLATAGLAGAGLQSGLPMDLQNKLYESARTRQVRRRRYALLWSYLPDW